MSEEPNEIDAFVEELRVLSPRIITDFEKTYYDPKPNKHWNGFSCNRCGAIVMVCDTSERSYNPVRWKLHCDWHKQLSLQIFLVNSFIKNLFDGVADESD